MEPGTTASFTTSSQARGERLDRWLASQMADLSRSALQRLIGAGHVHVDGQPGKPATRLEPGQVITVVLPEPEESRAVAQAIPLSIVYEDEDLLVVDKPAGLVVHPAPGHPSGTLVNAVLHHCPDIAGVGGERRPGIVHRLDRDTSGLIVVAKNDTTHRYLQRQFARRDVHKEYIALLEGVIRPEAGRICAPIGRHPVHRKRMAVLPPSPGQGESRGRAAVTEYATLGVYSTRLPGGEMANFSLVRAMLHTGRTHQIRVHFAWMKHPLVGDELYGYRRQRLALPRHFLHAHKLGLRLPDGTSRTFLAPLPPELRSLLRELGDEGAFSREGSVP